ncbi:NAD(P)/FAD-dependent oxidoreductase [Saccharospirillum mangrovi]|uniref:NAD(P)/FAD-dependent oxidoreductase n=1 Tax=Saccharospirillum mangrovi TaxID=2161747 RepID=UPI000D38C512|nr:FAD-dependent oxidoreductase [Saccharospirillum mangrovi]
MTQRIAIIGSGIAGLTTARLLHSQFDIELYEQSELLGGHTHTQDVELDGKIYPVNTGFIVYNDWVYHNFNRLMAPLDVAREATEMSFSVRDDKAGLEYNGHNLDTLFAQRRNLFRPAFLGMLRDIIRFNKRSLADLDSGRLKPELTLGEYFRQGGYGKAFIRHYIVPMGAAIWSSGEADMEQFPALFFVRFFKNHGLLSIRHRPQWYVIQGGSRAYIDPLIAPFKDRVHTGHGVTRVERDDQGVSLHFFNGHQERFDQVVFACHSDQALALLANPTDNERRILGALPYRSNEVVLHTDTRLLPRNRKAWAAWNYHLPASPDEAVGLTYNMNILQNFRDAPETFCVTLNRTDRIAPEKIINQFNYAHPVFTQAGIEAQQQYHRIGNRHRSHFCGAYWFNGFHEDGVNSALRVASDLGVEPWQ